VTQRSPMIMLSPVVLERISMVPADTLMSLWTGLLHYTLILSRATIPNHIH
jgi:hypothetical protein